MPARDSAESRHRATNQDQFGSNAANYATSEVHAKGASLARMVELVAPEPTWHGLDLASAAGHTAFAFAPHIRLMVSSDLTLEMVRLAATRSVELGHHNVVTAQVDAERLPFSANSFDLVTSRIAPHHFPEPAAFVEESARVLRTGGVLAIVDNIVPDDLDAAAWYNSWEKRRDPSHARCLGLTEWCDLMVASGLEVQTVESMPKLMRFQAWVDNMSVPDAQRPLLLDDLFDAPPMVSEFLLPTGSVAADATFTLTEGLIIARRGQILDRT